MKTKLICVLSLFLLCGCNPRLNDKFVVTNCGVSSAWENIYEIEMYTIGDDGKKCKPVLKIDSPTPLKVGSIYIFRMEEAK